jgi:hypothetical protein
MNLWSTDPERGFKDVPGPLLRISRISLKPATFVWVFLLAFITFLSVGHSSGIHSGSDSPSPRASFAVSGDVGLSSDFKRWEHVGTRVKTSGQSVLDRSVVVTPKMMAIYVEPSAFAEYKKTGKWPDGIQIVKELGLIKIGDDCDKVTFTCSTPADAGIFKDHFIGVRMMVKDGKRFPAAPGNWVTFAFSLTTPRIQRHPRSSYRTSINPVTSSSPQRKAMSSPIHI